MVEKIIWTPEALLSFKNILQYLKENWSEKEITNFINQQIIRLIIFQKP